MAALVGLCCNISFIHNVIYPTNALQIAFATNAHLISSSHAGTFLYQRRETENNLNPGEKNVELAMYPCTFLCPNGSNKCINSQSLSLIELHCAA